MPNLSCFVAPLLKTVDYELLIFSVSLVTYAFDHHIQFINKECYVHVPSLESKIKDLLLFIYFFGWENVCNFSALHS